MPPLPLGQGRARACFGLRHRQATPLPLHRCQKEFGSYQRDVCSREVLNISCASAVPGMRSQPRDCSKFKLRVPHIATSVAMAPKDVKKKKTPPSPKLAAKSSPTVKPKASPKLGPKASPKLGPKASPKLAASKKRKANPDLDEGEKAGGRKKKATGDEPDSPSSLAVCKVSDIKEISEASREALLTKNITMLFEIQQKAFGPCFKGLDVVGRAKTGCGKTLAFVLPVVERIREFSKAPCKKTPLCTTIAPTRELARQIFNDFELLGKASGLVVKCFYGGYLTAFHLCLDGFVLRDREDMLADYILFQLVMLMTLERRCHWSPRNSIRTTM